MRTLVVDLGDRSYPIHIGNGLISEVNYFKDAIKNKRVIIVTNDTVAPLYLDRLKNTLSDYQVCECILPDGEKFKTLDSFNKIITTMLENSLGRDCTVIALGGGVIGDLAGFAAASYQRGVDFIQVPTTILSQVDSSVGGKTGVNHELGKNMIGAFYQPKTVVIDLNCLKTLPKREISAGLAEVVKYGIIWDYDFFQFLESNISGITELDNKLLEHMIYTCCSIKAEVVHLDEREGGVRALLNLGHTFGHAIESYMGYGVWLHGEAVAAGMVIAANVARLKGFVDATYTERIKSLLEKAGLPAEAPKEMTYKDFLQKMVHDKKVKNGCIRYVIPTQTGKSEVMSDISEDIIVKAIEG